MAQLSTLQSETTHVVGADWEDFRAYMHEHWTPGQHMALVGPTGEGKSTFAVGLLKDRNYVLALDPKGGDDTLAASGFLRTPGWPPPEHIWQDIADGKPARLILGRKGAPPEELAEEFRAALNSVLDSGGWTVYVDEFQIAADRRMMKLDAEVERLLVSARYKKVSIITSFQAPAWVPSAATRQARWIMVWPTRDDDCIKRVAEKAGRDKKVLMEIVHKLPSYHALVIPPKSTVPMIITKPPKVNL